MSVQFHHNLLKRNIMKKNMGTTDQIVRTVAAVAFVALLLTRQVSGITAVILGVLAVIFLGTSVMSFCPLYAPCKISTVKKTSPR